MTLPPLPSQVGGPASLDNLSPQERVARINSIRQRIINGETVSDDEVRMGVRLLTKQRQSNVDNAGKKKSAPIDSAKRQAARSAFAGLRKS